MALDSAHGEQANDTLRNTQAVRRAFGFFGGSEEVCCNSPRHRGALTGRSTSSLAQPENAQRQTSKRSTDDDRTLRLNCQENSRT